MSFNVLMVTSEAVPFAKSGGLADMVSALSSALREEGADVRILMPRYGSIPTESLTLVEENFIIPLTNREEPVSLYETRLPDTDIPVYLLDSRKYFGREGIYGPAPASSYPDNAVRFSLLSKGAFQLCRRLEWTPDIFHSHDWPTGLNPVYLKDQEPGFADSASVFTIHNMGYQGTFSIRDLPWAGVTPEQARENSFLTDRQINYLKAGIENARIVTTVSPTYAGEIQTEEYGHGLDTSLSRRKEDLFGIVNGVDYSQWNPETDTHIAPDNYGPGDLSGKGRIKQTLQKEMGLPQEADKPLFAMITRLVEQKGIRELCEPGYGILESFCREQDVQVVVLGTGESWVEDELKRLGEILPNLAVRITYNEKLSHMIEAGADFFMMPSRYEPCGLNQLYSLKYGTLPIVRKTGGLADTVIPFDEESDRGTGFVFTESEPAAFRDALDGACRCWYDRREQFDRMRRRAMEADFSWKPSAREYLGLYSKALARKKG